MLYLGYEERAGSGLYKICNAWKNYRNQLSEIQNRIIALQKVSRYE